MVARLRTPAAALLAYYTILSSAPSLVGPPLQWRIVSLGKKWCRASWPGNSNTGWAGMLPKPFKQSGRGAHQMTSGLIATILSIATLIVGVSPWL